MADAHGEMTAKVNEIIDKVRPYVEMHGGSVYLQGIKDGVVTLKVSGACEHCSLAELTYNKMLGTLLKKDVPGVTDVVVA